MIIRTRDDRMSDRQLNHIKFFYFLPISREETSSKKESIILMILTWTLPNFSTQKYSQTITF